MLVISEPHWIIQVMKHMVVVLVHFRCYELSPFGLLFFGDTRLLILGVSFRNNCLHLDYNPAFDMMRFSLEVQSSIV